VVEAWRSFDAALQSSPWLAGSAAALEAFTLDDAVLSRSLYFVVEPAATDLAPLFFADEPTPAAGAAARPADAAARRRAALRLAIAPLRIAWEQRYAALLGAAARDLLAYQEAQRFKAFEQRARGFEEAYVAFLIAARTGAADAAGRAALATSGAEAARRAAAMGLYGDAPGGRVTEASRILGELARAGGTGPSAAEAQAIAEAYEVRQPRFL
jgi:hypothetical protein